MRVISGNVKVSGTYQSLPVAGGTATVAAGTTLSVTEASVTSGNVVVEKGAVFEAAGLTLSAGGRLTNQGEARVENITFNTGTLMNEGIASWVASAFLAGANTVTNAGQMDVPAFVLRSVDFIQRGRLNIADGQMTIDAGES